MKQLKLPVHPKAMTTRSLLKETGTGLLVFLFFYSWFRLFGWLFSFIHICAC